MKTRWMIRADMPRVLEIDRRTFRYCWDEPTFLGVLQDRSTVAQVIEKKESVVGYVVYQLIKSRLKITRMAIHPNYRNKGCGTSLINKLKIKLSPERRHTLEIVIDEYLTEALLFFKSQGFVSTDTWRNYWPNGVDGIQMEYTIKCRQKTLIP